MKTPLVTGSNEAVFEQNMEKALTKAAADNMYVRDVKLAVYAGLAGRPFFTAMLILEEQKQYGGILEPSAIAGKYVVPPVAYEGDVISASEPSTHTEVGAGFTPVSYKKPKKPKASEAPK